MKGSKTNLDKASEYTCKIRLLDDSETSCDFKKDSKGQHIFAKVCDQLNLLEQDYFGLRFVDNNKQRHWLDITKDVGKQLKYTRQPYMFFFRVRFYPSDPGRLHEEITRYQLFLQLKRDILHGRLLCPFNHISELAAYIVQAEIGDYAPEEHQGNYISDLKLLPRQSEKLEERIGEIHRTLQGLRPAEAENGFLEKARQMDLYGVDPHPCREKDDSQLYLGLTPQGVQIIRDAKRVSGFSWSEILELSSKNRTFYIQVADEKKKKNYAFRLHDTPACRHLRKCAEEHKAFYSDDPLKAQSPRRSALSILGIKNKTYSFPGKTESQLNEETKPLARETQSFVRTPSIRLPSAKKLSLPRSSVASTIDDRRSNDSMDRQPHQLSTEVLNDRLQRLSHSDTSDPLRDFETSEFPEPQLGSSRSSIAVDDELPILDLEFSHRNHTGEQAPLVPVENSEPKPLVQKNRFIGSLLFWLLLVAILLIPAAVLLKSRSDFWSIN